MKNKPPIISYILLAVTSIIFVYIRLRLLSVPLERDEGEYAYAGQRILHGGVPYRDIYNMKFPGVYYFYALLLALFGNSVIAIRLGMLIINLITAFFILKTAQKIKNLTAGAFAAASFIIFSSAPHMHGIMANTEHFVNLFISIGSFFLFSWIENGKKNLLLLTGLAAGLACLMKQHGAYFIAVAFLSILICSIPIKQNPVKIAQNIMLLLLGFSLVIGLLFIIVIANGTFSKFIFLTIKYGSSYISYTTFSDGIVKFFTFFLNNAKNNYPIWILTIIAIVLSFKILPSKTSIILMTWFILSVISVFPGYYFREHYFLLMVPISAIYCGLLFEFILSLENKFHSYAPLLSTIILFIITLSYLLIGDRKILFTDSPAMVSFDIYGTQFNEAKTVSDTIRNYLQPNQSLLLIGSEPEVYFYTKSKAASSYMYVYPMTENQPYRDSMIAEFVHQALHNKPQIIVATGWWVLKNGRGRESVLNPLLSQPPGYYVKGICYQNGAYNEPFIWNKGDVEIPRDSLLWKIYIRKAN